jgi:NAD dependent epimerase/dehydratase family enzyme
MPWIHVDDLVGIIIHTINNQLDGAYNAVAHCDTNKFFMRTLAQQLKKPFFFPAVPAFVMRMLFGEMADVLLKGTSASNQKITQSGFEFKYPSLRMALTDILT